MISDYAKVVLIWRENALWDSAILDNNFFQQKYFAVEKYFDVEPLTLSVERGGGFLSTVSSFSQLFCYILFPPQLTKISDRHFLIPEKISVQLHTVNF